MRAIPSSKVTLFITILFLAADILAQSPDSIYEKFAQCYKTKNAEALSRLYSTDGEVYNNYENSVPSSIKGRKQIEKFFSDFFKRVEGKDLSLSFKISERNIDSGVYYDKGYYQLTLSSKLDPPTTSFGSLATRLVKENNEWVFSADTSSNASFLDFDNTVSKIIPETVPLLFPAFYDSLLGNYVLNNGDTLMIGRSQVYLFAYDPLKHQYRRLNKVDAHTWTSGATLASDQVQKTYKFSQNGIEIIDTTGNLIHGKKINLYQTEGISYRNIDGISLGGTLFRPLKSNGKAIVLVHGSGPQDRNGYASIIRLTADLLAKNGVTVLTYDKQGVGSSAGNSEYQSFTSLARDALTGIQFLKDRKDLKLNKIGLGGSSQAGWIIAKALEANQELIDFCLLFGAAGSGISVIEQNLYNTEITMKCLGNFKQTQIENALLQQKLFFRYLKEKATAKQLDSFTKKISIDKELQDWIFPTSNQIDLTNRNQWFTALEIDFDPMKIWASCNKPVLMIFSEYDDSTPSLVVKRKIDNLQKRNLIAYVVDNAQHLGLQTTSVCENDLTKLSGFHPYYFQAALNWIKHM
jgi:pimeloyl-ACP methyl ester carboxylesterase